MTSIRERLEETRLLMEYAVPAPHRQEALALVTMYDNDLVALNLLHAFYSYLPEAREDGIRELRLLARRSGNFLLAALTFHTAYYYLVNQEEAEFLGECSEGIWEEDVLAFFELGSREEFMKSHRNLVDFPVHEPAHRDPDLCPVCAAAAGEEHTLGCPVEVCPWCGGQLTSCNCRFLQLGEKSLIRESQIEVLREKLKEKGRIPYEPASQRPAYPAAGEQNRKEE
jgi:hypothetical protein